MKVAILAPVAWRTPPRHYGPWEQVASNVAEGLVEQGFSVTLFATDDSLTRGKLDAVCAQGYEEARDQDAKVLECLHISNLMEKAAQFDIIHNHFDFLPLTYSGLIKTPMVTTIHGFSSPKIIPVYKKYNRNTHYVSISYSDRSRELDYIATVYNGLRKEEFRFNDQPGGHLVFLGRIHPDKGPAEAISIAKKAGRKLLIAGIIQDEGYFKEHIKPRINDTDVIFLGHAGPEERRRLLSEAAALLHPIRFEEPFGMSVAEAMLSGTPVIAFNKGSMPELIKDGETGFLVNTVDEANAAVGRLDDLSRVACRTWAEASFTQEKMVQDYIRVYETILSR